MRTSVSLSAATASDRERRVHPRVGLRLPVSFLQVAGRPPVNRHGVTLDVSRRGVRFRSGEFLPPQAFLALNVCLPGGGSCAARGRAVWSRSTGEDGQWEVGAEFLGTSGDADAALAEALALRA